MESIDIRPATSADAAALAAIFRRAILAIDPRHYGAAEKKAWLTGGDDVGRWQERIGRGFIQVATGRGQPLGFIEYLPEPGHVDCLFTDPNYQRRGVASALLATVLATASVDILTADVSKAALAFFERRGFVRQRENHVQRSGLRLVNYRMAYVRKSQLPAYCRPKLRIVDDDERRHRLCQLLIAHHQRDLATWAMRCVRHILPLLSDTTTTAAIQDAFVLLEGWQKGQVDVATLRRAGFALHRLAKEQQNSVATAVLRAAGQAVGVGHMREHAPVCGDYAIKAVGLANAQNPHAVSRERQWQLEQWQQIVGMKA